jgi:hypothetical protein
MNYEIIETFKDKNSRNMTTFKCEKHGIRTMETKNFKYVYDKPEALVDKVTHYCPGCGHGIVHKLLAGVIDELGVREKAIIVAPVGCSVLIYDYMNFDEAILIKIVEEQKYMSIYQFLLQQPEYSVVQLARIENFIL